MLLSLKITFCILLACGTWLVGPICYEVTLGLLLTQVGTEAMVKNIEKHRLREKCNGS